MPSLARAFDGGVPMLYSGMDLRTRSLVIHMLDADGGLDREAELATRREAVTEYSAPSLAPTTPSWSACRAGGLLDGQGDGRHPPGADC